MKDRQKISPQPQGLSSNIIQTFGYQTQTTIRKATLIGKGQKATETCKGTLTS